MLPFISISFLTPGCFVKVDGAQIVQNVLIQITLRQFEKQYTVSYIVLRYTDDGQGIPGSGWIVKATHNGGFDK